MSNGGSKKQKSSSADVGKIVEGNNVSQSQVSAFGAQALPGDTIVIVGISANLPGARSLDQFWQNLVAEKCHIDEIPPSRWDWSAIYGDPQKDRNKTDIKWGAFIEGIDEFDPLFFGISPREAELMDPQHRLLLQHSWSAIEDAGHAPSSLSGSKTGVFIACGVSGFAEALVRSSVPVEGFSATGLVPSVGANRINYLLNLRGPSETVETACSSSLVALNRAILSIKDGECDSALVGAVNTIISPDMHVSFSKAGMLSKDGRCKTFSNSADGYVRGEGVGVIFIKKLADAQAAGDQIYAVVRSVAVNHGGRANTLTSPNVKAQSQLLKTAYRKAGIDPSSVGYIEAHGTGTPLGDPIEINGLKSAFGSMYTEDNLVVVPGQCGVGSVKTNIGHLELAAGIAGIIKVVLQLKHKMLVRSLHCDQLNQYIKLENSPFFVVDKAILWKPFIDSFGNTLPRRGGISSFGFGGVNAHAVLEEYLDYRTNSYAINNGSQQLNSYYAFVLSARTKEQLVSQARQLKCFIEESDSKNIDLSSLAFTLQCGRDVMKERLAIVAQSLDELTEKLDAFVGLGANDVLDMQGIYYGRANEMPEMIQLFDVDVELRRSVAAWFNNKNLDSLLKLWVKGLKLDWVNWYTSGVPMRMHLPTYPFLSKRFDLPRSVVTPEDYADSKPTMIHENTSSLYRQSYSSRFSGNESYIRDHKINGIGVLPGVAYIEMIREALISALEIKDTKDRLSLRDIVWIEPIKAQGQTIEIETCIEVEEDCIGFFIRELAKDFSSIKCTGKAHIFSADTCRSIDIDQLREKSRPYYKTAAQFYQDFDVLGVHYGPAQKAVSEIYVNQTQVLARLEMSGNIPLDQSKLTLHPSIMDAAFQCTLVALELQLERSGATVSFAHVPFSVSSIDIYEATEEDVWAWVRPANNLDLCYDISLVSAKGRLLVEVKGLTLRALRNSVQLGGKNAIPSGDAELKAYLPRWIAMESDRCSASDDGENIVLFANGAVLADTLNLGSRNKSIVTPVDATNYEGISIFLTDNQNALLQHQVLHIVWSGPEFKPRDVRDQQLLEDQSDGLLHLFWLLKALFSLGFESKPIKLTVITDRTQSIHQCEYADATHSGISGLVGALAKESKHWQIRHIDVDYSTDWQDQAFSLPFSNNGFTTLVRNGCFYQQRLIPIELDSLPLADVYKSDSVYMVIGGAGGLGTVWSEHVLRRCQSQLVWVGRRNIDDTIRQKLDKLSEFGPRPVYMSADATDYLQLQRVCNEIKSQFGRLDGVLVSTLALMDAQLTNMSESQLVSSLAPKVQIPINLSRVLDGDKVDFIIYFSSINSFIQSAGQSNYSAGCVFNDTYSNVQRKSVANCVKVINWGYWGEVGVVAGDIYRRKMSNIGFESIASHEGMKALDRLMSSDLNQIAVIKQNSNISSKNSVFMAIASAEQAYIVGQQTFSCAAALSHCLADRQAKAAS